MASEELEGKADKDRPGKYDPAKFARKLDGYCRKRNLKNSQIAQAIYPKEFQAFAVAKEALERAKESGEEEARKAEKEDKEREWYNKVRMVGFLRTGGVKDIREQVDALEKAYSDFAEFKPRSKMPRFPMAYEVRRFTPQQQRFLAENPRAYEMWLINGEAVPMYQSPRLRATWPENIGRGINYNLFWDIDLMQEGMRGAQAFEHFLGLACEIVQEVQREAERTGDKEAPPWRRNHDRESRSGFEGGTGDHNLPGVDFYGYYVRARKASNGKAGADDTPRSHASGSAPGEAPPSESGRESEEWPFEQAHSGIKRYKDAKNAIEGARKESPYLKRIRCCKPFRLASQPAAQHLIQEGFFYSVATVIYLPKSLELHGAVVELEPREVVNSFRGLKLYKAHVFLGSYTSARIARLLKEFIDEFHPEPTSKQAGS